MTFHFHGYHRAVDVHRVGPYQQHSTEAKWWRAWGEAQASHDTVTVTHLMAVQP